MSPAIFPFTLHTWFWAQSSGALLEPIVSTCRRSADSKWTEGGITSHQVLNFLLACHLLWDVNTKLLGFKQRLQPWKLLLSFARNLLNVTRGGKAREEVAHVSSCGSSATSRASTRASVSLFHPDAARWKDFLFLLPWFIIPLTKSFSSFSPEDQPDWNWCCCRAAGMKYW